MVIGKGSEDMATKIPKNRWFWPPHCRLRLPHHETPTNISRNALHFAADSMGLSFFKCPR